jgi:5-methylcytosine-specific restriction endonuclease McrA
MPNSKSNSIIWTLPFDEFVNVLNTSSSFSEVLKRIGLQTNNGANLNTLKRRIKIEHHDISILENNRKIANNKQTTFLKFNNLRPNSELFTSDSHFFSSIIRRRILKESLLPYCCSICRNIGTHLDQPLTLQLDHINGINNDHRLENLRWLCPNCHSQTDTYSGKKSLKICNCGKPLKLRKSSTCKTCALKAIKRTPKIQWPSNEELIEKMRTIPLTQIAKILQVSDNAIRGHCKRHDIPLPKRGRGNRKF